MIAKTYAAQWFRPELDLKELALLKFKKGLTIRQIAKKLGVSKSGVTAALKRMEAHNV